MAVVLAGCADMPVPHMEFTPTREFASLPLPYCRAQMDQPDYWIGKLPNPDAVLLTSAQIDKLNRMNERCGLITNVFSDRIWDCMFLEPELPESGIETALGATAAGPLVNRGLLEAYSLYTLLKDETERIKSAPRWDAWGNPVPPSFFGPFDENLNLDGICDNNPVDYGLTRQRTDVRYYPTYLTLTSRRGELDFDILQVSALRAMQPLAVLHASRDGKWLFVISPFCQGWVWKDDVIRGLTPEEIKAYLGAQRRLVVIGHAAEAVWQPGDSATACRLYMGTAVPLTGADGAYYQVALPDRADGGRLAVKTAYISCREPVQEGYLACTPRNIYLQAFGVLHTPYSWGGKGEYRDCSQLMMDVFATMGVNLPRNSSSQGAVGSRRVRLNRKQDAAARQAQLDRLQTPALLQFPGHIMLYLGREGERHYAIHDIWSWRKPDSPLQDRTVIIGQVVVSDLSLGEGSRRGSLLERLTTINTLHP